jgi:hypothetical protein
MTSVALGAVGVASGCFQELDPTADRGGAIASPADGGPSQNPNAYTTWQLCQSPSCDLPSGEVPYLDQTPPIFLADGGTTLDPCAEVEEAANAVRQTYCATCHQAPADQAGINFILDDAQLVGALSQSATDDAGRPLHLVVPGDPTHSYLYMRVAQGMGAGKGGMPPLTMPGYPTIVRPTPADLSVLYSWILACAPGTDGGAYDFTGGNYAPGDPGAGDASGDYASGD